MSAYTFVLIKGYCHDSRTYYDIDPLAASDNYQNIVEYAKKCRDDILQKGDSDLYDSCFVEYPPKDLVSWDGYNYYTVGTNDRKDRIIFRIKIVKRI